MRKLLIDPLQNTFKLAITEDDKVIYRGSRSCVEDVRALEKLEDIDQVFIDAGYLTETCMATETLWGWKPVKFKVGETHVIDDAIYT